MARIGPSVARHEDGAHAICIDRGVRSDKRQHDKMCFRPERHHDRHVGSGETEWCRPAAPTVGFEGPRACPPEHGAFSSLATVRRRSVVAAAGIARPPTHARDREVKRQCVRSGRSAAPLVLAPIAGELMPGQSQLDQSLPVGAFGRRGALHRRLGFMLRIVLRTHEANSSRPIWTSAWQFRPYDCGGRKSRGARFRTMLPGRIWRMHRASYFPQSNRSVNCITAQFRRVR